MTAALPPGARRWTGGRLAATLVAVLVVVCPAISGIVAQPPDPAAVLELFLARPFVASQYRATRHLEAQGSGQRGWLDVESEFTPGGGMRYTITAQGGSGLIRSRVLRSLIDEERDLIANGQTDTVAIAAANYEFGMETMTADGLQRIRIKPKRKERALIDGTMFLMPSDGELIRVEGRLAKNPSLWMKRVEVVRAYARINGVLVPTSLDSVAHLRLLGRSTLRMTYHYTEVDNQPVVEPASQ